jgi:hypothetical protein
MPRKQNAITKAVATVTGGNPAQETPRLYLVLTIIMLAWLAVGLTLFIIRGDWENIFLTLLVIGLIVGPAFLLRQSRVHVPHEFQLIAVAFVFLTLFLGSARDFYYKFWWWDWVIHTGSGFLLGVIGWIALFLLNQTDRLPKGMRPSFLCLFGLTFAVFVGVVWEIFEFAVDQVWPEVNMQSTETGVADTMHDLIVDTIGATVVALMGWAYFRSGRYSFLADGVKAFLRMNPRLFRKGKRTKKGEGTAL